MTTPKAASKDAYGRRRYAVTNPETGEEAELISVTRLLKLRSNPAIETWKVKTVAAGLAHNPDLVMLAASGDTYKASKQALDREQAAANKGTAVHAFINQFESGLVTVESVPELVRPWLANYAAVRDALHWKEVAGELTIVNFEHGYAGTFDLALKVPRKMKGTVMSDVKTGQRAYPEVALQLAAYAHGEHIYNPDTGELLPMPKDINFEHGMVILLHKDGCTAFKVPLLEAWEAFKDLADLHRRFATIDKYDFEVLKDVQGATEGPTSQSADERTESSSLPGSMNIVDMRKRRQELIANIQAYTPAVRSYLAAHWPAGVPTFKEADIHTAAQLAKIDMAMMDAERASETK